MACALANDGYVCKVVEVGGYYYVLNYQGHTLCLDGNFRYVNFQS